jgi:hypothetical protein
MHGFLFRRCTACLLALLVASVSFAQSNTRRVYLKVVGEAGAPVTDLGTADVAIAEGGNPQRVTRVALSNLPMRIAILVDTGAKSQIELPHLRAALNAFVDAIPAPHELLLVTTGQNVRVVVQPTADRAKVKGSVDSLFAANGGTLLFDALLEMDNRFMRKTADRTPLFVIVTGDATESSQRFDERALSQLGRSLADRGVAVHGVALSRGTLQAPAAITLNLARTTRGRAEVIGASSALQEKLAALATEIVNTDRTMSTWYEVDYASASKDPQGEVHVTVLSRSGVKTELALSRRPGS